MTALFKDQSRAQIKNIFVFSFVLMFILNFDLPFFFYILGLRYCFVLSNG